MPRMARLDGGTPRSVALQHLKWAPLSPAPSGSANGGTGGTGGDGVIASRANASITVLSGTFSGGAGGTGGIDFIYEGTFQVPLPLFRPTQQSRLFFRPEQRQRHRLRHIPDSVVRRHTHRNSHNLRQRRYAGPTALRAGSLNNGLLQPPTDARPRWLVVAARRKRAV